MLYQLSYRGMASEIIPWAALRKGYCGAACALMLVIRVGGTGQKRNGCKAHGDDQ